MPSEQPPTRVEKPRMALRPYHDDPERLDDVVVEDVAMFRAEMMDDGHLWMACYFDKSGTAPDLHFSVIAGKTGRAQLHLSATDVPPHIDIDAAPDEPAAPSEQPREGTRVDALAEALFRAQNSESEWPPMRWSNVGNEYLADAWREKARNLLRRLELLPSEPAQSQPREGTRVYTIWLCGDCKAGPQEPTKGGWFCGECGASNRTSYLDQAKVVRCEPAQPQPRGEGEIDMSGKHGNRFVEPAEGDDLAARVHALADAPVEFAYSARDAYRYAARLARASTHPEQSARVTGEQALALAGWIEGNVWQDSTVDVADLLRVLGGFE